MPKTKKIPLRKCAGCNEQKPKKELIRVLHTPEDAILVDRTGKQNGRGVYLCPTPDCYLKAKKTKALERSLGVTFTEETYASLDKELMNS